MRAKRILLIAGLAASTFGTGSAMSQPPAASSPPMCYEGTIGTGPRLRRVIVERPTLATATVHLYTRPARQLVLAPATAPTSPHQLSSPDGLTTVTFDSTSTSAAARLKTRTGSEDVATSLDRVHAESGVESIVGEWSTAIGPGGVLRLIARLAAGPCAQLVGTLDSPDQGQRDLPLTAARISGDSVILEAAYMDLRITFFRDGSDERRGTLVQNGVASEIVLRRGARAAKRPQEPARPLPYVEREVRFPSRSPGVTLGGTLAIPETPGPHPAIVLISGSGAQDRDETIAGHRPFLVLSDHLTRLGYAVLRTDDRGVGASTGNVLKSGLHDIADDVRGTIDYLRGVAEIDRARIGLLGHSEGGYVAPIVAADDPSVAFVMLMAAPAVRGRDVFIAQRSLITRAGGASPLEVRVDSLLITRIFSVLDSRPADDSLAGRVDAALTQWLRSLPTPERAMADSLLGARTAAQDSGSVEFWKSRWFKSMYHHDPAAFLRRIDVPVLAILGELDVQVPAEQSLPVFELLYQGRRRGLLEIHRIPGINHMLQPARRGGMDEYVEIEETIAPVVLTRIDEWLTRVVPVTALRTKRQSPPAEGEDQ